MVPRTAHIVSALSVLLGLTACGGSASPPATASGSPKAAAEPAEPAAEPAEPAQPAEPEASEPGSAAPDSTPAVLAATHEPEAPPSSPTAKSMRDHFAEALLIRAAVIAGKPGDAAAPAEALTNMDRLSELPKAWHSSMKRMQAAASRVKGSADVAEAAAAAADIGVACGLCHQKLGGPAAKIGSAPEPGDTLATRMLRHAWATERLWEGLYVPSSPAWAAGAKALQGDPFEKVDLKRGGVYARSAAKDFAAQAAKTIKQQSTSDRAAVYATLLGTCATCHIAMGKGK